MQHAEAHERLSDLALEPARLARLETDRSPGAADLREHLAACEACAADLAGWRRTWAETGPALKGAEPLVPLRPSGSLRARVLAAVAAERATSGGSAVAPTVAGSGVATPRDAAAPRVTMPVPDAGSAIAPEPIPLRTLRNPRFLAVRRAARSRSLPWLVAAAAIVVAVVGGSVGWTSTNQVARLQSENTELAGVAATFDRVLATPRHWTVALKRADGSPGGTLAWTASEIVVVTTGLPAPGPGQTYRCWVEENGSRAPMGAMSFSGTTGYWAGSMAAWANASWANAAVPGVRFGVSLVPDGGLGAPVLLGTI